MRQPPKPPRRPRQAHPAARDPTRPARPGNDGPDAKLVPALTTRRRETAQANAVPPYVIFHDATFAEMVRAKPNDLAALGRISGIGEAKLKKYGAEVLAVLIAGS
jgi:ATP-dependent DNA helicase RecQ